MSTRASRRGFLRGAVAGSAAGFLPVQVVGAEAVQSIEGGPSQNLPVVNHHPMAEIEIAVPRDPRWGNLPPGLHGSFVSKDLTFLRHEVPSVEARTTHKLVAWRGERAAAALVLYARNGAKQVRVRPGPLAGKGGTEIPADRVSARFVRYVLTNLPYGSSSGNCEPAPLSEAWLMPDLLDTEPRFGISAETTRPVWLSVDVPADAEPGLYRSELQVVAEGGENLAFNLELEVQAAVLPPPREWRFQLDLWQNPCAVAACHQVEPWSAAHLEILRPHLRMLAEAGAKFITTYLCHSPWKDDTYIADATMVEWVRRPDGSWEFDYSIFDRYVELAMECGITRAITCYTPLPWQHRVRFLDGRSGDYVWEQWAPDSAEFRAFWSVFLKDLRRHLTRRGWFERTYIGINENPLPDTLAAIAAVREDSPEWKITYAGKWHPELSDLLDDYCVIIDEPPTQENWKERRSAARTTTFYVCCYPARPNNYPFSPTAENTWMGWHAAAQGYDGFLRWAYDSWTADPVRDTRHFLWPSGDCFMVYPGARSSVRFERIREGIVDFEKVRLLKDRAASEGAREETDRLEAALKEFTYARVQAAPAADAVNVGKEALRRATAACFGGGSA